MPIRLCSSAITEINQAIRWRATEKEGMLHTLIQYPKEKKHPDMQNRVRKMVPGKCLADAKAKKERCWYV